MTTGNPGIADQLMNIPAVLRIEDDADARRGENVAAIDPDRHDQRVDDPPGDDAGVLNIADIRQQHTEDVAADPPENVGFAQRAGNPPGDLAQQFVAGSMAEGLIEFVEAVDVDHHDPQGQLLSP
jgi:hypothetical protein